MSLYGFIESDERELFELVQTVSGIGPKVALAITAAMSTEDLAHAVNSKDESAIAAVQGIGKKGAQRLILELDGKLDFASAPSSKSSYSWRDQVIEAQRQSVAVDTDVCIVDSPGATAVGHGGAKAVVNVSNVNH